MLLIQAFPNHEHRSTDCEMILTEYKVILNDSDFNIDLYSTNHIYTDSNSLYIIGSSVNRFDQVTRNLVPITKPGNGPNEVTGPLSATFDDYRLFIYVASQAKVIVYNTIKQHFEGTINVDLRKSIYSEIIYANKNYLYFKLINRGPIFSYGFTDRTQIIRYDILNNIYDNIYEYDDKTFLRFGNLRDRSDHLFEINFFQTTFLLKLSSGLHVLESNKISNLLEMNSIIYQINKLNVADNQLDKLLIEYENRILHGNYSNPQSILYNFRKAIESINDHPIGEFSKVISNGSELFIEIIGKNVKYLYVNIDKSSEHIVCGMDQHSKPIHIYNGKIYAVFTNPHSYEQSIIQYSLK